VDRVVLPPLAPTLARLARELPCGDFQYEPKWDGFRCLAFAGGAPVAEVAYGQVDDGRLRFPARLVCWRPDRAPGSCTLEQLEARTPELPRWASG